MDVCFYASDLTDVEWALLKPLVLRSHPAGRRKTYPLRRLFVAIFLLLRTGAQWRLLPHEYARVVPSSTTMSSGVGTAGGSTSLRRCAGVIGARSAASLNRQPRSSTVNWSKRLKWEDRRTNWAGDYPSRSIGGLTGSCQRERGF